jgi:hypothetical protein
MIAMPLRFGPLVLCVCVALYRAAWLSAQLSGFTLSELGYLLLADLPVLGVLGLLAFAEAVLPGAWRRAALVLTVLLVAFYLADVVTVLSLNARLQLSDLRMFGTEWWLARSFVSAASVTTLVVAAGAFLVRSPAPLRVIRIVPASALVLVLLPFAVAEQWIPSHLQKYTGSVLLLGKELWGARRQPISRYRPADFAAYRREYDALFEAPIARTGTDVVLVIVESLSAADSYRTSGIRNMLPRFDDLSREGMLFRNFFANYEASEGGIVALLSGVPPLHFPTASTNTFGEYAAQRGIVEAFTRARYRSEFLTAVPLQFISMDAYAHSALVGFTGAAGQHETPRYRNAPRYGFQSPGDHVLYEEVLARLDERPARRPAFMALITASSHPPFVDPLGKEHNEENAWAYVQKELWWLHDQLRERGFFDNGILLITGDHRRMSPVPESEREVYGESAKARIPLVIIGKGAPKGVLDDRLFQQSDLLRMLDRALQPGTPLSPFVTWAERYVFVYGVASNASNVEVFDLSNGAREGFKLKLRGADIEWLTRPPNALAVERAIHRQRALQQAVRAARVGSIPIAYGRELQPSADARGVLVGVSSAVDLSRDPDARQDSLASFVTDSFALERVLPRAGARDDSFTLTARAFVPIAEDGEYWFSVFADHASCLAIDKEIVLGCKSGLNEGVALLTAGLHRFDLRFIERTGPQSLQLRWLPPGAKEFADFPQHLLVAPEIVR